MGTTFYDLITTTEFIVKSGQYTTEAIQEYLNQAYSYVVNRVDIPSSLAESSCVITGDDNDLGVGAFPEGTTKFEIVHAETSDGTKIKVHTTWTSYVKKRSLSTPSTVITDLYCKGGVIYAGPKVPHSSTATIKISTYSPPVAMSASADEPDYIPEHLRSSMLCNFAAMKIFGELNGDIARYSAHKTLFDMALAELVFMSTPEEDQEAYCLDEEDFIL